MRTRNRRRILDDEPVVIVSDDDEPAIVIEEEEVVPTQPVAAPASPRPSIAAASGAAVLPPEPGAATAAAAAAAAGTSGPAAAGPAAEPAADEAGSSCNICYELMYEEGNHRPAALKCGHIFGSECIKKWLQQRQRCPQCNQKAKAREITLLYNLPKSVAAGSSAAELERQLQEAQRSRQREAQRAQQLEAELRELRQIALRQQQQQQQPAYPPPPPGRPAAAAAAAAAATAAGYSGRPWEQQQQQGSAGRFANQPHQQQQQQQYQPLPAPSAGGRPLQQQQQWQQQQYRQQQQQQWQQWQQQRQQPGAAMRAGQKRPWEQATSGTAAAGAAGRPVQQLSQQQQQQQQPAAAAASQHGISGLPDSNSNSMSQAVAPASSSRSSSSGPLLALLPVLHDSGIARSSSQAANGAAAGGGVATAGATAHATAGAAACRRWLPGSFAVLQQFELCGSRCFHLNVAAALLLVGETPGPSCSRLRKVSLVCPGSPSYLQLPTSSGVVRCLAGQREVGGSSSSSNLMAVATEKAGLQIANLHSNNMVQSVSVKSPVWSVAWSPRQEHQLLLGLDKGRMAVVDMRKSSHESPLVVDPFSNTNSNNSNNNSYSRPSQPLHSLVALQGWQLEQLMGGQGGGGSSSSSSVWSSGCEPEAIVACAGGVYSWGRSQPDSFNLLLPNSWHGGTCESVCVASEANMLAASFRAPLGAAAAAAGGGGGGAGGGVPVHLLAKLGLIHTDGLAGLAAGAVGQQGWVAAAVGVGVGAVSQQQQQQQQGASGLQYPAEQAAASLASPPAAAAVGPGQAHGIAAAVKAGREQLLQQTLRLSGHTSSCTMTHGCFMPQLPGVQQEQHVFVSADEVSCEPRVWGCSIGAELVPQQAWQRLPTPVLQVSGGQSSSFGVMLGAMSERRLLLYEWVGV